MIYKTRVVWTMTQLQDLVGLQAVRDKALEWDSRQILPQENFMNDSADQVAVFRFWSTEADAQEWIDFVQTFNPISTRIDTDA